MGKVIKSERLTGSLMINLSSGRSEMKKTCSLLVALFASNFAYADYYDKVERCENSYKIESFYEMDFDKVHGEAFGSAGASK